MSASESYPAAGRDLWMLEKTYSSSKNEIHSFKPHRIGSGLIGIGPQLISITPAATRPNGFSSIPPGHVKMLSYFHPIDGRHWQTTIKFIASQHYVLFKLVSFPTDTLAFVWGAAGSTCGTACSGCCPCLSSAPRGWLFLNSAVILVVGRRSLWHTDPKSGIREFCLFLSVPLLLQFLPLLKRVLSRCVLW